MSNVIDKAIERRKVLQAEIARLDEFISIYRDLERSETQDVVVPAKTARARPQKPLSKSERIQNAVAGYLNEKQPQPTDDLLARLTEDGIEVGGKSPRLNLSSILSHGDQFQNARGAGWSLVTDVTAGSPALMGGAVWNLEDK